MTFSISSQIHKFLNTIRRFHLCTTVVWFFMSRCHVGNSGIMQIHLTTVICATDMRRTYSPANRIKFYPKFPDIMLCSAEVVRKSAVWL
jgi:hypothetical protein